MSKALNHVKVVTTTTASITTASVTVLAENARRLYAEITNSSDVGVWLNFGEAAVVGEGVYLAPNGFSFVINSDFMWRGTITARAASGAGKVLGILEGQ